MEISQIALARLSLIAFFLGTVLSLLYDVLRVTRTFWDSMERSPFVTKLLEFHLPLLSPREKQKKPRFLCVITFFEDFIFCILVALILILLFYQGNNGKLRIPVLLCGILGFLVCRLTLSRVVARLSELIVFSVYTAVRYVCFFIFLPFRFAFDRIKRLVTVITRRCILQAEKRSRRRFTNLQVQRIDRNACGLIFLSEVRQDERKIYGTRKEKAIQPELAGKNIPGTSGDHFHRRVREQHDVL